MCCVRSMLELINCFIKKMSFTFVFSDGNIMKGSWTDLSDHVFLNTSCFGNGVSCLEKKWYSNSYETRVGDFPPPPSQCSSLFQTGITAGLMSSLGNGILFSSRGAHCRQLTSALSGACSPPGHLYAGHQQFSSSDLSHLECRAIWWWQEQVASAFLLAPEGRGLSVGCLDIYFSVLGCTALRPCATDIPGWVVALIVQKWSNSILKEMYTNYEEWQSQLV